MKVPKSEQNSKNAALSSMHKQDESHPITPGGGHGNPHTPGSGPGDNGGPGSIKTEIKEERNPDLCANDIKKELQHNGLDNSLDDLKPTLEADIKPKIEDCLDSLTNQDGDKGAASGMGHDIQPIPTPNSMQQQPQPGGPHGPMDPMSGMQPGGPVGPPLQHPQGGPPPQQIQQIQQLEGHFMQQQSQIFVFSTSLANKAADSVRCGQYKSIHDFHVDQEGTKQFLEKQPKMSFRGGPLGMMGGLGGPMNGPGGPMNGPGGPMNGPGGPMNGPGGPMNGPQVIMNGPGGPCGMNGSKNSPSMPLDNSMSSVEQWVRQQNANLEQGTFSSPPSQMNPGCLSPTEHNLASILMEAGPNGGRHPNDMQSPNSMMNNPFGGPGGMGPQGGNLLQSNKVPDENLTPEQLQRREESLANLRKIQAMLFPEQRGPGGPGQGMPGGMPPGMMGGGPPGGPGGMPPGMMSQGMSSGPGMHSPNSMVSSMAGGPGPMGPNGGPPMGPGGPFGPGPPPNFENLTPAQREWFKLQQEYYTDKRRKQEMDRMRHFQQMQQMGINMPPGGPEGPPPYFNSRMRGPGGMGPMSPTSPSPFNGPPGMGGPQDFMMGGPRRPGPMNFNGPGGPSFDPMGMGPGGPGPMGFPFKDDMLRPPMKGGSMVNMPMIQRAGNPEQFNTDIIPPITGGGGPGGGPTKPPPPYGQSNKRKRSGEDLDDLYKKLQPAPSPQQFSYLNQFEGQELTITKQLNMAYQETPVRSPAQNPGGVGGPHSQGPPSLPPPPKSQSQHGSQPPTPQPQPSPRPPTSNTPNPCSSSGPPLPSSSVTSPLMTTNHPSSRPSSVSQIPLTGGGGQMLPPSPHTAAANASQASRLSHFEGMPGGPPLNSGGPGKSKESMNNITSASLASLAKGVEHLSNQMQQNMMHGGPFHNIQIQGQMGEMENNGQLSRPGDIGPPSNLGGGPLPNQSPHSQNAPPNNGPSSMASELGGPSVNNTFVNATMSIGQVNIQSVHPGSGPGNYSATMQMQQMNNELMGPGPGHPNMGQGGPGHPNMGPGGAGHGHPNMGPGGPGHPNMGPGGGHNLGPNGPNGGMGQGMGPAGPNPQQGMGGPNMPPNSMAMSSQQQHQHELAGKMPPSSQASGGPTLQRPFPGQSPSFPGDQMIPSPGLPPRSTGTAPVGNANVQIQAKAPNTIQYLPANPPSSQPQPGGGNVVVNRKDMDMGGIPPRFPSPLSSMDPGPRTKFMPPQQSGQLQHMGGPGDMMNPRMSVNPGPGGMHGGVPMGGPGSQGGHPHMQGGPMGGHPQGGHPGGGPQMGGGMSMQQSMMIPGGGSMQQQMGGMPYGSPGPSPMHPGPGGPSPVMMGGPEMMQAGMQMQSMSSMQGGGVPMGMGGGHGMRPDSMMGGPGQPGYNAQFHQFQQQLYAQGRPRGMHPGGQPMGGPRMMGGPDPSMMGGHMMPGHGGMHPDMASMMQGGGPGHGMMVGPGGQMVHPGMGHPGGPVGMGGMMPGMPNMP